jgi:hypothetical protein
MTLDTAIEKYQGLALNKREVPASLRLARRAAVAV